MAVGFQHFQQSHDLSAVDQISSWNEKRKADLEQIAQRMRAQFDEEEDSLCDSWEHSESLFSSVDTDFTYEPHVSDSEAICPLTPYDFPPTPSEVQTPPSSIHIESKTDEDDCKMLFLGDDLKIYGTPASKEAKDIEFEIIFIGQTPTLWAKVKRPSNELSIHGHYISVEDKSFMFWTQLNKLDWVRIRQYVTFGSFKLEDLNFVDVLGGTALITAIKSRSFDNFGLICDLIDAGVDLHSRDGLGMTAIEVAIQQGYLRFFEPWFREGEQDRFDKRLSNADCIVLELLAAGADPCDFVQKYGYAIDYIADQIEDWIDALHLVRDMCTVKDLGALITDFTYNETMLWKMLKGTPI